jgi:hypothetical protein
MARFDFPPAIFGVQRYLAALAGVMVLGMAGAASANVYSESQTNSTAVTLVSGYNGSAGSMKTSTVYMNNPAGLIPGTIIDMYVTVDMSDTSVGDLTVKLLGPGGTTAMLLNRPGASLAEGDDNGDYPGSGNPAWLSATIPITYQESSPSGTHSPSGVLSENMGNGLLGGTYVGLTGATGSNPNNFLPDDANAGVGTLSNFYGQTVPTDSAWTLEIGLSGSSGGQLDSWTLWIETNQNGPFDSTVPEPATVLGAAGAMAGLLVYLTGRRGRLTAMPVRARGDIR